MKDARVDTATYVIALLVVVAGIMRIHHLETWSLAGDELNTLRDSLAAEWTLSGPKPLLFFLNAHLVGSWRELDELGLRLLPALFGIASISVIYWLGRRVFDTATGLFAAVLLTFSPWHLLWSQTARYYTLVLLLTCVFPLAFWVALRERRLAWLFVGLGCAGLAILAHPSSGLVLAGSAVWALVLLWRHFREHGGPDPRVLWGGGLLLVTIAGLVMLRLRRQLVEWYEFGEEWGFGGAVLALSYVNWISVGICIVALAGLAWMWRDGRRDRALLLGSVLVVPLIFATLVAYIVSVSTAYLFATVPFVLLAAGYFLARIWTAKLTAFPSRLVSASVLAVLVAATAPTLVSHYRDGTRPDYRAAMEHVEARADPGDRVVGDHAQALRFYSADLAITGFSRDPLQLEEQMLVDRHSESGEALWLIVDMRQRGGLNDLGLGSTREHVQRHCLLSARFGAPRFDYRKNEVDVYRCEFQGSPARSSEVESD